MALVTERFIKDTQGDSISVIPIVVLADLDEDSGRYIPLDFFSTSNITLEDKENLGNYFTTKEILERISSIKNDIDYENKRIKTNTFRFSLYNYYDITKSLTESDFYSTTASDNPLKSLIGKYVMLHYKTQKTSRISLLQSIPDLDDYDDCCSIMFYGIVNRVTESGDKISIQAEDFSQQFLKEKQIPTNKVGDLPLSIKDNISGRDDSMPIPMVFGKVDKSPCITYSTNYENADGLKSLCFIHDSYEINGKYKTSKKIGSQTGVEHLYVEDDDDYLEMRYNYEFRPEEGKTYFLNYSDIFNNSTPILPELEDENKSSSMFGLGYMFPVSALSDINQEDGVSSLKENISLANTAAEPDMLWYNGGYEKKWYRESEGLVYNSFPDSGFIIPPAYLIPLAEHRGRGRWALLRLEKKKTLTELWGHINLYGEDEQTNNNTTNHSWYCKPFNPDHFIDMIENSGEVRYWDTELFGDVNYINQDYPKVGYGVVTMPISGAIGYNNHFVGQAGNSQFIEVLEADGIRPTAGNAISESTEVDRILIFEYFNRNNDEDQTWAGANFNNMICRYISEVSNPADADWYASIEGRRDANSTINMDELEDFLLHTISEITPSLSQLGGYEIVLQQYFVWMWTAHTGFDCSTFLNRILAYSPSNFAITQEFIFPEYFEVLTTGGYTINNLGVFAAGQNAMGHYGFSSQIFHHAVHGILKKFWINCIQKVVWTDEQYVYFVWDQHNNGHTDIQDFVSQGHHSSTTDLLYKIYEFSLLPISDFQYTGTQDYWANTPATTYLLETKLSEFVDVQLCIIRRILKYLYQTELNVNENIDNILQSTYDAEDFLYEWDSFDIDTNTEQGTQDLVNNLTAYLDDTINVANKAIFDFESNVDIDNLGITGWRQELYVWNDDPLEYGQNAPMMTDFNLHINLDTLWEESFGNQASNLGQVVEKPVDIFINIFIRELNFGIDENKNINKNMYNVESIQKSREEYDGWKMGFCINENKEAKTLIEDISKETKSFLSFSSENKLNIITVKDKYVYEDIDHIIDSKDVIKHKTTRTKRENIITNNKYYYRYDIGLDKYEWNTGLMKIKDFLPNYDGDNYYNIDEETGYKEKELSFHSDKTTAEKFQKFDLFNNCNQHLLMEIELPLSYSKVDVGSVIHIPLINNKKAFGLDYSKVEVLNGQYIYPLWLVTGVDIGTDKVKIKAFQLHYLDNDNHGFLFPDEEFLTMEANLLEYNTWYQYPDGSPIKNWNYLPPDQQNNITTYIQGLEIPYGDVTGDGMINVTDITKLIDYILEEHDLTIQEIERGDLEYNNIISITDIIVICNIILSN